jgi:type I restriction enzyme S subunit
VSNDRPLQSGWESIPLGLLLREPLRNGHSARATEGGPGVPTLSLGAVTYDSFTAENVKQTIADPAKVADLWLEPGDILIERANTPALVGTAALFSGPRGFAIFPDLMIRVRLRPDVSDRYVAAFLKSPGARRYFQGRAQGNAGSMPKIDQAAVESLAVPLAPRGERDRIVATIEQYLSDIDAGVAALERALLNHKRYRASVLKAACDGKLVLTEAELARREGRPYEAADVLLGRIHTKRRERWDTVKRRGRYEEPSGPSVGALGELPEGWAWTCLGDLAELITSGSRGWGDRYADAGPLFIRAQDIKTDRLTLETVARVDLTGAEEGMRTRVCSGDLLVTITGANVTKTAAVVLDLEEAYVSQHVGLVRPVLREVSAFLFAWVISPAQGRRHLEQAAYGAGKPGLNLDNLRELPVALPPLAEQHRIVAEVDRLLSMADQTEAAVRAQLARAERLRQAVLKHAFEGKLVPQDPSDEPASVLLERLRAEGGLVDATRLPGHRAVPKKRSSSNEER